MIGTGISWCDDTVNLWWGCTHHGPGCANCYAEAQAKRYGWAVWGPGAVRRVFPDLHFGELDKANALAARQGASRRVFVGSMMDVAEGRPDLLPPARRFLANARRWPWLDLLLLTKRPENYPQILPADWGAGYPTVWLLASAVTQAEVQRNAAALLRVPARVRGLSLEPLLEPVRTSGLRGIDWRIVGGESGGGARPFDPAWAAAVVADGQADGAAVWVKQLGTRWARDNQAPDLIKLGGGKADRPDDWPPQVPRRQDHPLPRRTAPATW